MYYPNYEQYRDTSGTDIAMGMLWGGLLTLIVAVAVIFGIIVPAYEKDQVQTVECVSVQYVIDDRVIHMDECADGSRFNYYEENK